MVPPRSCLLPVGCLVSSQFTQSPASVCATPTLDPQDLAIKARLCVADNGRSRKQNTLSEKRHAWQGGIGGARAHKKKRSRLALPPLVDMGELSCDEALDDRASSEDDLQAQQHAGAGQPPSRC